MKNILIVGATSAIAIACARKWAAENARFFLVARNGERLQQVADDLTSRGAQLSACYQLDIDSLDRHAGMLERCQTDLGAPDIVLVAPGTLPDQAKCQADPVLAVREFNTNAVSVIALLTPIANILETQKRGALAVISSVAGDRGRPSNYLYGSAKAALSAFCEGLNARLFKAGVHVVTVKPGFVATPMTAGLPLPGPLVATPDQVASDIVRAIEKRKDVLYTRWFWAIIMLVIRCVPRFLFKRASL
ncbi:SDR family oxidoreductase [Paraburkholderia fungorum]|jgi:decaprenylphospho-beta-D-erythro-pentofuranosid-2-ulose 2-reductase|uniref:SDR family oxidoreductase n=1 Tax=Paraburkholderia fungorum TaxID=134537 RepID=UPI0003F8472F|nr:SDR family oxidoreductase [Paraburkholderia fungorum]PZR43064.1 MAG: short-chain dehydrogenase [Paraburkholderia fungorum]